MRARRTPYTRNTKDSATTAKRDGETFSKGARHTDCRPRDIKRTCVFQSNVPLYARSL